jgi:broad specificity phosphatase PhoE
VNPSYFSEDEIERRAQALAHEIADKRIEQMTADDDDLPRQMSTMEKFANNLFTIVIARGAMIVTPILLGIIWNSMDKRIEAIEADTKIHTVKIQDHESRLVNGRTSRVEFQEQAQRNFAAVEGSFRELNAQIVSLSGSIIRLQTTIENRLPPRSSSNTVPQ